MVTSIAKQAKALKTGVKKALKKSVSGKTNSTVRAYSHEFKGIGLKK